MVLGSHAESSDVVSQLSWSFCVGSDPKNWWKNSSERKTYMGMNNSEVSIERIIHVYSRERGITISALIEKILFRTGTQYKRGSTKGRMELVNGVRMEGGKTQRLEELCRVSV